MSSSVSAYTTLESLLLFQCLHAYGVGTSVFGRISDLLKRNPEITGHKYYQGGRLSPDALRNFYLERLRKEVEYEQGGDNDETNGDGGNPRKRKKASPILPSVQESLQHQHLIPKLVNKLYASYRYEMVEQIRAEEERYEKLQRELKSIERGEWDDQLRERANGRTPVSRSPTLPRKSPHLAQKPLQPSASTPLAQNGAKGGQDYAPTQDGIQQPPSEPPRPLAMQNGQTTSPRKKHAGLEQRRAPSTPQPLAASPSPQPGQVQPLAAPPRFQQPPIPPYNGAPYAIMSPFVPGQQPPNASLQPGPHQNQGHPPPHMQASAAGLGGQQYQPQPLPSYGNNGMPQYISSPSPSSHHSPTHQPFQQHPPGPQSPSVQIPHQQQRPYFPPPQHLPPSYQPQYAQPPPQAGFMLPPFQVSPQDPSRVHPHGTVTPQHPQVSTPISNRQPQSGRAAVQTPGTGRSGIPPIHPLVTQARQSFSTPTNSRSPLSIGGTPVSAKSRWKLSHGLVGTPVTASPRPVPEPIDDFEPLALSEQSSATRKSTRRTRGKARGQEKDSGPASLTIPASEPDTPSEPRLEESAIEPETRSGRPRRKAATKRTRLGSIASSRAGGSVRDRSRSQSILSHTETIAADNESQAENRIKSERGTSLDPNDEEAADTPPQMTTRRRGAAAARRKRTAREASLEEPEDQSSTPGPPKTISASRYFARACAPIMNDIQSHRHASTFSAAVRAKDAEGYYDIIKRPTDLKSIQKAIATGSRLVAAAASDTPAASPGGLGGVVELPVTSDNRPPKAIVNAAQLEKEIMRMFVNAVMFNPGEEGVVDDARQMFETVQQSVASWRNVERRSGRGDEGTPMGEEEEVVQAGKRRKV